MKVEQEFPDLFLCRHRGGHQKLLLQPFQCFDDLDSDFECRLRVLFGESLYTVAGVAGDQCPFGDGLDSESVKETGSKPEESPGR